MKKNSLRLPGRWLALFLLLSLLTGCAAPAAQPADAPALPDTSDAPEASAPSALPEGWAATDGWAADADALLLSAPEECGIWSAEPLSSDAWRIRAECLLPQDACTAGALLGSSGDQPKLLAGIRTDGSGSAVLHISLYRRGTWKAAAESPAFSPDPSQPATLQVEKLKEKVTCTLLQNGETLQALTAELTVRDLNALCAAGLSGSGDGLRFSDFTVDIPELPINPAAALREAMDPDTPEYYRQLARIAVDDVVRNFWTGDAETGKLAPTWNGLPGDDLPDWRGSIWETSMLVFGIYDLWYLTGDAQYQTLLEAEAAFFRSNFTAEELENAGGLFNWASDDCSWNAMMLLCFYTMTEDDWFLQRAIGLLDSADTRWYDEELGGLLYKDNVDYMSLYEVGMTLSWLRIWEITGETRFYDRALRSYQAIQRVLGRDDGLYSCEATKWGAMGEKDHISEGGSSSFLTGNMGMAALSAKFYALTGEPEYLERVYQINDGILHYYDQDGVLLNDRDAWTNGTFAAFYASWVLTLPDTEEMRVLLCSTAVSIAENARTDDGHYGGSWSGPAEGSGSIWYVKGSIPQQGNTTGTSVMLITAAAIAAAGVADYTR